MSRKPYPSDLSDEEWVIIAPLLPAPGEGGKPQTIDRREVLNAIFYVLKGGISWRMMPHEFPNWSTVYNLFRDWRKMGLWETINTVLREKVRIKAKREPTPSAAIIDSQSTKTSEKGRSVAMMRVRKSKGASAILP